MGGRGRPGKTSVQRPSDDRWMTSGKACFAVRLDLQSGLICGQKCREDRTATITGGVALPVAIYGIKNCDTMKKARAWLEKHGVDYSFHDYKTAGIERERLERWCKKVGWETLLNRNGTTFRKLPDKDKSNLDAEKALALMLAQPSMIKRPVVELGGGKLLVGFAPEEYSRVVAAGN